MRLEKADRTTTNEGKWSQKKEKKNVEEEEEEGDEGEEGEEEEGGGEGRNSPYV